MLRLGGGDQAGEIGFSHHDVAILCAQSVPLGSTTTINRPLLSARLRSNFNKLQAAVVAVDVADVVVVIVWCWVFVAVSVAVGKLVAESQSLRVSVSPWLVHCVAARKLRLAMIGPGKQAQELGDWRCSGA